MDGTRYALLFTSLVPGGVSHLVAFAALGRAAGMHRLSTGAADETANGAVMASVPPCMREIALPNLD